MPQPSAQISGFQMMVAPREFQLGAGDYDLRQLAAARADATVALTRAIAIYPMMIGGVSVRSKDASDEAREFIEEQIRIWGMDIWSSVVPSAYDYGWGAAYIKWSNVNGQVAPSRIRPILAPKSDIIISQEGEFLGLEQETPAGEIFIDKANLIGPITFEQDAEDMRGVSQLMRAAPYVKEWVEIEKRANQYDIKIAGAHVILRYIPNEVYTIDGHEMSSDQLAWDIVKNLKSNARLALPNAPGQWTNYLDATASQLPSTWSLEVVESNPAHAASFTDRLRYFDILKIRSQLFPERSVIESEFGTKAEAHTHAQHLSPILAYRDNRVVAGVNKTFIDPMIEENYPDDIGKLWIEPAPIDSARLDLLGDLLRMAPVKGIDFNNIADELEVPRNDFKEAQDEADARADEITNRGE